MVQGDDEVKVSGGGGDVGAAGILGLGARRLGSLAARDGGRHRAAGEVDFDFDVWRGICVIEWERSRRGKWTLRPFDFLSVEGPFMLWWKLKGRRSGWLGNWMALSLIGYGRERKRFLKI
jgi:hypothetical protein